MNQTLWMYPCAGLVVLALLCVHYALKKKGKKTIPLSSWCWMAPFALALAFLTVWGLRGLLEVKDDAFTLRPIVFSVLTVCCGYLTLRRTDIWAWYDQRTPNVQKALKIALVVGLGICSLLAIEYPFNELLPFGGPSYFWIEIILALVLLAALYFLGQRHAGLCGIAVLLFCITGLGQYFLKRFKNCAILPSDLLSLGTAAAVSKEYVYALDAYAVGGITFALLCVCLLALVRPPHKSSNERRKTITHNLVASAVSFGLLAFLVLVPNYMQVFGVGMKYWFSIDYYQMQGFYPTFIAIMQDMPIRVPEGYSDKTAQKLMDEYATDYRTKVSNTEEHKAAAAQFEQEKPTVIVVMNESFADLSVFDGMHAGYEGPEFFNTGFDDALARGTLHVTVHGAGTCNTEFEFLTGNALGFIGEGKYPYSVYNLKDVDAIAGQFKEWGYDTCAIHPNYASNWNRNKIYPQMGFDTFLSIDDFGGIPDCAVDKVTPNEPHCEVFHSGVSDRETYNRILQELESNSNPQFLFDVTMSNHGSYDQNNIPAEYQLNYQPTDFVGEETPEHLNEYLSCIKRSDDDLKEFVEQLRTLDRPVVLVFFGDHQPHLSGEYCEYWYPNEDEGVHARRTFTSNYVIWANYDVAGCEQTGAEDEISVDMLGSRTLELIGAPVSDYQAAQLDVRTLIPALSATDYQGNDRKWYTPNEDSPYSKAYHDMSCIEYYNFATRI